MSLAVGALARGLNTGVWAPWNRPYLGHGNKAKSLRSFECIKDVISGWDPGPGSKYEVPDPGYTPDPVPRFKPESLRSFECIKDVISHPGPRPGWLITGFDALAGLDYIQSDQSNNTTQA